MSKIFRFPLPTAPTLLTALLLAACSGEQNSATDMADSSMSEGPGADDASMQIDMDADDIVGVVTSDNGPEAGVWVIAETDDFEARFAKIVVTDDEGHFLIPDLPAADYEVWVRGYGLVDSDKVNAAPGIQLALDAVTAPNQAAAAQYYPAAWWASLLEAPPEDAFPMTTLAGTIQNQAEWVRLFKADWIRQQYGLESMREFHPNNPTFSALGLESTTEVLNYMMDAGQYAEFGYFNDFDLLGDTGIPIYAEWIDNIQAGAVPEAPPRPQGIERNIVVTTWDAGPHTTFSHDIVASDKRDPTVNANGNVYFSDWHHGNLISIDPSRNSWMTIEIPSLDAPASIAPFTQNSGWANPSPTWEDQVIIQDHLASSSLTIDHKGRIWDSSEVTAEAPDFCRPGSGNPFAAIDPTTEDAKDMAVYNPATDSWELIPTCYGSNHPTLSVDGTNKIRPGRQLPVPVD